MNKDNTHKPKPTTHGKRVFDVVRPGKVLADPSSRPIITSRTPHIQDQQFVKAPDLVEAALPSSSLPAEAMALMTHHADLKPFTEALEDKTEEREEKPEPAEEPAPEESHTVITNPAAYGGSAFGPIVATKTEPTTPEVSEPEAAKPSVEGLAVKNTVEVAPEKPEPAAPIMPDPKPETQPATTDTQAQPPLVEALSAEDMALSDEFDVGKAIVSHHRRGSKGKTLLLFLLVIVLAVVVVDVLLDAELIQNTYNLPHTELIN